MTIVFLSASAVLRIHSLSILNCVPCRVHVISLPSSKTQQILIIILSAGDFAVT